MRSFTKHSPPTGTKTHFHFFIFCFLIFTKHSPPTGTKTNRYQVFLRISCIYETFTPNGDENAQVNLILNIISVCWKFTKHSPPTGTKTLFKKRLYKMLFIHLRNIHPQRGRKLIRCYCFDFSFFNLRNIHPQRGRKLTAIAANINFKSALFTKHSPPTGTKTVFRTS